MTGWLAAKGLTIDYCISQYNQLSNLLREVAGFVDVAVAFLLQLVDDLALLARLLLVVLNLLLQAALGLLVKLHEVDLLLGLRRRLQHVLNTPRDDPPQS